MNFVLIGHSSAFMKRPNISYQNLLKVNKVAVHSVIDTFGSLKRILICS